jgi:hypothetical protein
MDQVFQYFGEALSFFRAGFDQVNAFLGLMIGLLAAFQLAGWRKLWEMALAATLFHIVALVLAPVIDHGAPIHLPAVLYANVLRNLAALYMGYVILIALFYFLRTRLLKPAAQH